VCGFPWGVTHKPRSSATATGVSFLRLPVESLAPHSARAFGADDDEALPRQQENRGFQRAPTGGYEDLLPHTVEVLVFGIPVRCLGLDKLIAVKRAAGRPKDLEAIAELEAIREEREKLGP
jgi:hypothetical protein